MAVVAIVLFVANACAFRTPNRVEAEDNPSACSKVALLVGINKYQKPGLPELSYAESDVDAVAAELKTFGFEVTLLKGSSKGSEQATRENIEKTVRRVVAPLSKDDVMLVMLSGHGQQLMVVTTDGGRKDEAYYCPVDGEAGNPATLFSLSHLVDDILAPNVGRKMLLVDACRALPPDPSRGARGIQGRGIQGRVIALPEDTAVFFSCRSGQESFERQELKHGLFTYCILEGLRGKAAQDNDVDWSGLVSHVSRRMGQPDMRRLMPADRAQDPIPAGGVPYTVLAHITAPPALSGWGYPTRQATTTRPTTGQPPSPKETSPRDEWGWPVRVATTIGLHTDKLLRDGARAVGRVRTKTIRVPADQTWTGTGIRVTQGMTVDMTATGEIEAAPATDPRAYYHRVPPQGRAERVSQTPEPKLPGLALLGRVGPNGRPFYIGSQPRVRIDSAEGELFLGINDDVVSDNAGEWTVRIAIRPSPQ